MLRSVVSVTGIVLAGAILFMYTQPTYQSSQGIQRQIDQYNQALQKAAELQKLKQQLITRYNSFRPEDVERLERLLPDHVDNVRLILDMDNMASRHGMGLKNVDVSTGGNQPSTQQGSVIAQLGEGSKKSDSLTVSFATSGTYPNFKAFLSDLEASLRLVDLTSLQLLPAGTIATATNPNEPIYNYNITLKTYWLK